MAITPGIIEHPCRQGSNSPISDLEKFVEVDVENQFTQLLKTHVVNVLPYL